MGASAKLPRGYTQIGDDVAMVPTDKGKLVLKVDMLVETTDVPRSMTYRQAARKAVGMCVSDFASKGVRPDSFMVSLGLRPGTSAAKVAELSKGFRDAGDEWGVRLVGGDTNEAGQLVIDCVMVGFATKMVTRGGARPGDVLAVTGLFGLPPAGLLILNGNASAAPGFRARALRSVLVPDPALKVGMALAPHLSSSMDSSDGLARSLHTLAECSGVGFRLDTLPADPGVYPFAKANSIDPEHLVLSGGEEYLIVGTFPPPRLDAATRAVAKAGGKLTIIGRATGDAGRVLLRRKKGWTEVADEGWTHLD